MQDLLVDIHSVLRWVVLVAIAGGGAWALLQAPRGKAFDRAPFAAAGVVVDLQVALGIAIYLIDGAWRSGAFFAVIHPVLMLAALALVHIGIGRARSREGGDAYRSVGAAFLFAFILIALGIPWAR